MAIWKIKYKYPFQTYGMVNNNFIFFTVTRSNRTCVSDVRKLKAYKIFGNDCMPYKERLSLEIIVSKQGTL